uniref:Uncharacterized protein n=1 Tax=Nelumbo nucifera TaxID=4432 RepID=A0A822XHW6_NELNU|nr:TPA_asm: hypothetical protein HUJ06_021290 [Nelumbo nucifera]
MSNIERERASIVVVGAAVPSYTLQATESSLNHIQFLGIHC